jgi:hypothetical protein
VSIIDPGSLPRLVDVLNRGEDPTAYVPVDYLGDGVESAVATDDEERAESAASTRALAHRFAEEPPEEGSNRERVVQLMWEAELIDNPGLAHRLIGAVRQAGDRAELAARADEMWQMRRLREQAAARRRDAWREAPEGMEWEPLGEWHLDVSVIDPDGRLDAKVIEVLSALAAAVEDAAQNVEASVRPVLPGGADLQVQVSQ